MTEPIENIVKKTSKLKLDSKMYKNPRNNVECLNYLLTFESQNKCTDGGREVKVLGADIWAGLDGEG